MSNTETDTPQEAWEDDECLFCVPEMHPNCEKYTTLGVVDRGKVPLGEDDGDHLVEVPVCAEHFECFERYLSADSVAEVGRL